MEPTLHILAEVDDAILDTATLEWKIKARDERWPILCGRNGNQTTVSPDRWCENCTDFTSHNKHGSCTRCLNRARRESRQRNLEVQRARDRLRYVEHRDQLLEMQRIWALRNPDRSRAIKAKWAQNNPESARQAARRRRARKQQNGIEPYRDTDIFDRDAWMCYLCGNDINPQLPRTNIWGATIDHVIPIAMGGADAPDNVRAAHLRCNSTKHTRDVAWTQEYLRRTL